MNTFVPDTKIESAKVNENFEEQGERIDHEAALSRQFSIDRENTNGLMLSLFGGVYDGGLVPGLVFLLEANATNYIELNPSVPAIVSNAAGFTPGNIPLWALPADDLEIDLDAVDADLRSWCSSGNAVEEVEWADVQNKPATFTPSTHTHLITDVEDLQEKVAGRGANLVANGNGEMSDHYNFTSFVYDALNPKNGSGSFKLTSSGTTGSIGSSDELIPIDPTRAYRLSLWVKVSNLVASNNYGYAGLAPYDVDGNAISPWHYRRINGTDTTLAAPLNPGDTTITLTSAANWKSASGTFGYERQIALYGYQNDFGYTYPNYTYTRALSRGYAGYNPASIVDVGGAWAVGGIAGNVITLAAPWPAELGSHAAGTAVSNNTSGLSFLYMAASNVAFPSNWTQYSGNITGTNTTGQADATKFPPGTSHVKVLLLANRTTMGTGGTAGNVTNFADVTFLPMISASEVTDFTQAVQDVVAALPGADGIEASTIDAKGDLIVGTADNAVARQAVGSNGQMICADSTQTNGLKWFGGHDTLADSGTVTWNMANRPQAQATIVLGGNRTLAITNAVAGASGVLIVKQDANGNRTLALPAGSKVVAGGAGAITLSTAADAIDVISFIYNGSTFLWSYGTNFS